MPLLPMELWRLVCWPENLQSACWLNLVGVFGSCGLGFLSVSYAVSRSSVNRDKTWMVKQLFFALTWLWCFLLVSQGGGPYYLIGRALGPEVGVSIGLCFFLGNAVAASLWVSVFYLKMHIFLLLIISWIQIPIRYNPAHIHIHRLGYTVYNSR